MIIEISVLIVCAAVLILILFVIPTIVQLRRSAKKIEEVSGILNEQLPSILENLSDITSNLNVILSNGRQQVDKLGEAADNIKLMVDDIVGFEKKIRHQIENPIVDTLITITAIAKAVRAFLAIFLDRK